MIKQLLVPLLLLALLAALASAQEGQVSVTVDASPREGGSVVIQSAVTSGSIPVYPYTFSVPRGAQLTLSTQPAPGFKLWYWLINGTQYKGDTVTVTVQGSSMMITAVFGPNATVAVSETAVAVVYVTQSGQVWVQPKPLQLEAPQLDQSISAQLYAVVEWVNETYTDPFGVNRTRLVAKPSFKLRLANKCRTTCEPVSFYAYLPNGTSLLAVTLADNETVVNWPNRTALLLVSAAGKTFGPYVASAAEPAALVPMDIAPFLPLLPLGLFVALAVRSNVRDAALGLSAYVVFASTLWSALGATSYVPITVIGFVVAGILLALDVFAARR